MTSYWTDNTQETEDGSIVPIPDPTLASTDLHGTMETTGIFAPETVQEYVTDTVDQAKVPREELEEQPPEGEEP